MELNNLQLYLDYGYDRSIIPPPNPSLVRKSSSSFKCESGFVEDGFTSFSNQISKSANNNDCCLVVDAMTILVNKVNARES